MVDVNDYRDPRNLSLTEATVQEIQLELIRRTRFNAMDGQRLVRTLADNTELWTAVLLDRLYTWTRIDIDLPMLGLIKLRDLQQNIWNADTLYILTPSVDHARCLERVIVQDEWAGEVRIFDQPDTVSRAWEADATLRRSLLFGGTDEVHNAIGGEGLTSINLLK